MSGKVERPALRWFGGKWRLAPWIIAHLPPHDAYVEPYGGAASVLLRKPPAKLETWNDLHGRLVNFFTVLRSRPDELVRALELTPYARDEYDAAASPADDPLEDARRFYVLAWQGRVGGAGGAFSHGWRYTCTAQNPNGGRTSPAVEFGDLDHLRAIAGRLQRVQIEHDDARAVIGRYDRPDVLHYIDPPYVVSTRGACHTRYAHELTDQEHSELAELLHQVIGMVVLSGYHCLLYDEFYGDWSRFEAPAVIDSGRVGVEVLWCNPAAAAALERVRPSQGVLAW